MGENGKAHRKSKSGGKALKAAKRKKKAGEANGSDEQVAPGAVLQAYLRPLRCSGCKHAILA